MTTVPKSFRVWKSDDNLPRNDPNRRSDAAAAWRGVSTARSSLLRFLCVHACVLLNPSQKKTTANETKHNLERAQFYDTAYFFTHNSSQDELLSGNERSNRTDPILLGRLRRFLQRKTSSLLIFHTRSTTRVLTC